MPKPKPKHPVQIDLLLARGAARPNTKRRNATTRHKRGWARILGTGDRRNGTPGPVPGGLLLQLHPKQKPRWFVPLADHGAPNAEDALLQWLRERPNAPVEVVRIAKHLGICRQQLYKAIQEGQFPQGGVIKVGKAWRLRSWAALSYIESATFDPQDPEGMFRKKTGSL